MKAPLLAMAFLLAGSCATFGAVPSPEVERRLQRELMAPCCYRESVDRHNSDVANRMKTEIHQLVLSGQSERQILDYYKSRYGAQILAEPEGSMWWFETLTPLVAFIMGAFAVTRLIRKWTRPAETNIPA